MYIIVRGISCQARKWFVILWLRFVKIFCGGSSSTQKAKNRTTIMGHTFFRTSFHLLAQQRVAWANLGILPPKDPPHTHNQAAHCSAQAMFQIPPRWLGQSERSLLPLPWDCHHLFDTRSGGCALRSWPETTIRRHAASVLCKPPWHHQTKETPEVLTQSKRISNTHSQTHTSTHWHN